MDKIKVVHTLDALAQETRLDIFRLLVKQGDTGMMVGTIAQSLGLAHATLSFHLAKLHQAGLITRRKQGRATLYCTNYSMIHETIAYLMEKCCHASPSQECDL